MRVGSEVIDGNADCLGENPVVPKTVAGAPYWGPITEVPDDRFLQQDHGLALPPDVDVNNIWWPELEKWIEIEMLS